MDIENWHQILQACEQRLRENPDAAVRVFNEAIARIARKELLRAVEEKMKQ